MKRPQGVHKHARHSTVFVNGIRARFAPNLRHAFSLPLYSPLQYKIPETGIASGVQFGMFGEGLKEWGVHEDTTFALNPKGDNLFLYCLNQYNEPHFVFGISYGNHTWSENGVLSGDSSNPFWGLEQSALPEELMGVGSIELPGYGNWRYVGPSGLSVDRMKSSFSNSSHWEGSDLRFSFSAASTSGESSERPFVTAATTKGMLVVITVINLWGWI